MTTKTFLKDFLFFQKIKDTNVYMSPKNKKHSKNKSSRSRTTPPPPGWSKSVSQPPWGSSGSSSSSSPSSSPELKPIMSDEYIALARAVVRCGNIDDIIVDRSGICYMDEFTNDMVVLPPDEQFPGCVRFFDPETHPSVFLNDKKRRQRTGTIITLKPETNKMIDFLKTANATGKSTSKKFITSAGLTQTSSILEQSIIMMENFYNASDDYPDETKTPEEYFTETISLRDQFERTLIITPSTPEEIKDIARERCKIRSHTIGEFRMKHKLFNTGYSTMYELFEEFEGDIAASLLERNLDNNKIYQYYVGIN